MLKIVPAIPASQSDYRPATRTLPTTAQLFLRALNGTDFLGDVTPTADLGFLAVEATDAAIEQWEAANDVPAGTYDVSAAVITTVRRMLVRHASDRLMDAADAANDAFRDARDSGDVDADGEPVAHDTYRAV
jgi:hypothetical protein